MRSSTTARAAPHERRARSLQCPFPRGTGVSVTRWSPKPQREVRLLGPPPQPDPGFPGFLALWSRLRHHLRDCCVPHRSAGIRSDRSPSIPRVGCGWCRQEGETAHCVLAALAAELCPASSSDVPAEHGRRCPRIAADGLGVHAVRTGRLRDVLRWIVVGVVAVAAGAIPLIPAGIASAATVPVLRCPTEFGISESSRRTPSTLTVSSGAGGLVAYTNTEAYLLGPRGMRCSGIVAVDGGSQVVVWPQGDARPGLHAHIAGLTLTLDPACTSCKADDACPFFTALARALDFPCASGVPADERVYRLRSNVALFEDPPGVAGSGWPSGGPDPANGVVGYTGNAFNRSVYRSTCTLPASQHAVCTASLNYVISRYG